MSEINLGQMNKDFIRSYDLSDYELGLIKHALSTISITLSISTLKLQKEASEEYVTLYKRLEQKRQVQPWTLNISD